MSNYVNNKELYNAICEWKKECKEKGLITKPSDYIGNAVILISEGLSNNWRFVNYTNNWKDEMVSDGIEMSIKGLINFNEEKYTNPHAYISQACFNAFLQRIAKEKKEEAKKYKYFVDNVYDSCDSDMVAEANEDFIQDIHEKLNAYEKPKVKPPKPKVKGMLDFLLD